jgi:hypothetical protein
VTERGESRIAEARRRALDAKQKLCVAAAAAFVAIVGLAWASHPGSSSAAASTSTDQSSVTADDSSSAAEQDDDFGVFNSFGSIAPSGGATPQAQTHVS